MQEWQWNGGEVRRLPGRSVVESPRASGHDDGRFGRDRSFGGVTTNFCFYGAGSAAGRLTAVVTRRNGGKLVPQDRRQLCNYLQGSVHFRSNLLLQSTDRAEAHLCRCVVF